MKHILVIFVLNIVTGLHIKMKDPNWAGAVESFLGAGTLRSFCADNAQDAKVLNNIMKEVFREDFSPQIMTSKFFSQVPLTIFNRK